MKEKLLFFSIKHPLLYILLLATVLRLLAVIFTEGFYWRITEYNFNYYRIPETWLSNPWIVYISRLVFGAFSLLIITLSYRITKIIADKTTALEIALLLSCFWMMPYVSVHSIPAIVSIPFVLYGTLLIVKQDNLLSNNDIEKFHRTTFIIAGFFLGLGFAVCLVSFVYYLGVIIALFILKNWKGALMTLIGYIFAVGITQTVIDIIIYHRPFVEMTVLFQNIADYLTFGTDWGLYALVLLIAFIPPMSFMLITGFIRVCFKYLLLLIPTLIMFLFAFFTGENNFEAILIIIPTYLIGGYVGWKEYYKKSEFWTKRKWPIWTCYSFFALLNTLLLICTYFYL